MTSSHLVFHTSYSNFAVGIENVVCEQDVYRALSRVYVSFVMVLLLLVLLLSVGAVLDCVSWMPSRAHWFIVKCALKGILDEGFS